MSPREELRLEVLPQPDDSACGPTCLHAVYRYWGLELPLSQLQSEVAALPEGGTLAVSLAGDALRRGYRATIYSYNVQVFDPTWFDGTRDLQACLVEQERAKRDEKLSWATASYLEFLRLGGELRFEELDANLLRSLLKEGPVMAGLSATYLYGCARELDDEYDDIRGYPTGHFVVLSGVDRTAREAMVADPLHDNPGFGSPYYRVGMDRLIAAIYLGIVTYDANLLVISPPANDQASP